ncbi:MAG TPA: hypothetical protein VND19_10900 [Acetobacteraceae bacterium]|nr:hypothetical protein [Acetobacteraceae bacterium]
MRSRKADLSSRCAERVTDNQLRPSSPLLDQIRPSTAARLDQILSRWVSPQSRDNVSDDSLDSCPRVAAREIVERKAWIFLSEGEVDAGHSSKLPKHLIQQCLVSERRGGLQISQPDPYFSRKTNREDGDWLETGSDNQR